LNTLKFQRAEFEHRKLGSAQFIYMKNGEKEGAWKGGGGAKGGRPPTQEQLHKAKEKPHQASKKSLKP